MRCLVTGASGFIGSKLVSRLLDKGFDVVGLTHSRKPVCEDERVKYIKVDIADKKSLEKVEGGFDFVFHCAAYVRDYGKKEVFYRVNVEGTKNIVELSRDTRGFVYISHIPYEKNSFFNYYSETKIIAEKYLLNKYREEGFPVVVIRPGNVYGPGWTPWVTRVADALFNGKLWLIDRGEGFFHHTYIDNLVDAILLSMERRAEGRILNVTDGEIHIWRDYFRFISNAINLEAPTRSIPGWIALSISYVSMVAYKLFGVTPIITPFAVNIFTNKSMISIDETREALGYTPKVSFSEGVRRVSKWLREEWLPIKLKQKNR